MTYSIPGNLVILPSLLTCIIWPDDDFSSFQDGRGDHGEYSDEHDQYFMNYE